MGWSFPWVSSADSDFNVDFGVSYTDEQVREQLGPILKVWDKRHHFDPPHRIEPERLAGSLRAIWARGSQLTRAG